jgi:hypothetical protein
LRGGASREIEELCLRLLHMDTNKLRRLLLRLLLLGLLLRLRLLWLLLLLLLLLGEP